MEKKSAKKSIKKKLPSPRPREEKLYGNAVNLSGLYAKNPLELKFDDESDSWWDRSNNMDFNRRGLQIGNDTDDSSGIVKFTGTKREVECFTMGVRACFKLLSAWAWCPLKKGEK